MEVSQRYIPVANVKQLVVSGANDDAVVDAYNHLLTSGNVAAAATNYLAVAGFVCHHRPHLAERLLWLPIDCMVQLGIERPEQVLGFVRFDLDQPHLHFIEDAGPEGLEWLADDLPRLGELVEELLADGIRRYSVE